MEKIFIRFLLCCILTFVLGCNKESQGYDTIEALNEGAINAIKSKNKEQITDFVTKMLPDKNSAVYMKNNDCIYRGFPEELKEFPNAYDSAIVIFTERYLQLSFSLEKQYGSLDNLHFIGYERELSPEPLNEMKCKCQDVLFEEPMAIWVFKNSNDSIKFKVGEVLKVNNKWKVFSDFKLFY